jgi:allophanate hydrolase subunit 2
MGSCSTFLPAGFGGHHGRALQAGDQLALGPAAESLHLQRVQPPVFDPDRPLRVVPGPQAGLFDDAGLAAFFSGRFQVAAATDRRGIRLTGPVVTHARIELASQGVLPGAVQVPPDGQPLILGWDGPVTGGYPVIAGVIAADWPRLSQLKPGDRVQFTTIEAEEARALAAIDWTIEELG